VIDTGALRGLVRDLNFDVYAVDVTVDPLGEAASVRGLWLTNVTDAAQGFDTRRRESRRVIAIKREDATLKRGDLIVAPDLQDDTQRWYRVESPFEIFDDHTRYTVAADPEAEEV
jgi:hypothetical protein